MNEPKMKKPDWLKRLDGELPPLMSKAEAEAEAGREMEARAEALRKAHKHPEVYLPD